VGVNGVEYQTGVFHKFKKNTATFLTIDSTGNVGVNATAPNTQLTIECNTTGEVITDGVRIQNIHGINNDIAPMYFGVHGGVKRAKAAIGLKRLGSYGIGELRFAVDPNGDDADVSFATDTKMTIDSAGNVGIGGSPSELLHLYGVAPGNLTESCAIRMHNTGGGSTGANTGDAEIQLFESSDADATQLRFACASGAGVLTNILTLDGVGGLATFSAGIAQGGTSGDDTANIDSSGVLRIRRESGAVKDCITFDNGAASVGSITTSTTATQFNTSSDYRLKENVTPITGALDRLDLIPAYNFNFKSDPTKTVDGFLAHEVAAHVPEAISGTKDEMQTVITVEAADAVEAVAATLYVEGDELPDGVAIGDEKTPAVEAVDAVVEVTEEQPKYQGIDQSKLVPLMLAAIKELKAKVTALENA
jgi:hypothetical protein